MRLVSGITYRRADSNNNFAEMARLLYNTDPYIYPYWKDDEDEFVDFIVPWMNVDNFIFNFRNFYIAHEKGNRFPVAIMVTVNNHSAKSFNYGLLKDCDPSARTAFVVDHYLRKIDTIVQELPREVAYGVALCVDRAVRSRGIGSEIFESNLRALKRRGINTLYFDCLKGNHAARAMYEKHGFEKISRGFGFDGTDNSKVEIVTYAASGF